VKASQEVVEIFQGKREAMALLKDHIHRGACKAFVNNTIEHSLKLQLLLEGERIVNKALGQALKSEATKIAARMFIRL
jgi:hypothetical protein